MTLQLKKYLSLFLLVLFLFPMLEKGMHDFEHRGDIHCNAKDKHFHSLEHNCSVCDHTIVDVSASLPTNLILVVTVKQLLFHPFVESIHAPGAFQYLPARAPPIA